MRVILAGGGTAGHINPALSIANFILSKEPQAKILYVGAKGGMEEKLVPLQNLEFKGIKISGFQRKLNFKSLKRNLITAKRIVSSGVESEKIIKDFNPDLCIGTGGYVSGPILRKAHKMGIPIIIHEQNAFPGITTKLLSRYADVVMLAVDSAQKYFSKSKARCVVTGNPIRNEIIKASKKDCRKKLNLDDRPMILSFGGSLGAKTINDCIIELIDYSFRNNKFQHIHGYGQNGMFVPLELAMRGIDLKTCKNIRVTKYINDMDKCLAACDLVISRAGAITLSEIEAKGKPCILIPSTNVAENHQYHNAMVLVNKGAAEIIAEKDLTPQRLIDTVESMLKNKTKLEKYAKNSLNLAILDANEKIYKIIKETINGKSNSKRNHKHKWNRNFRIL